MQKIGFDGTSARKQNFYRFLSFKKYLTIDPFMLQATEICLFSDLKVLVTIKIADYLRYAADEYFLSTFGFDRIICELTPSLGCRAKEI